MKKIELSKLVAIEGGIRWKNFADGFCDGLTVGSLLTGGIGAAAVTNLGCDFLGVGSNMLSHLPGFEK